MNKPRLIGSHKEKRVSSIATAPAVPKMGLFGRANLSTFTVQKISTRPGSLDILKMPSRMGGKLYYPEEL